MRVSGVCQRGVEREVDLHIFYFFFAVYSL